MKSAGRTLPSPSSEWDPRDPLKEPRRPRIPGALILLSLLLLGSCATVPEREPGELFGYLPRDHNAYISIAPNQESFLSETLLRAFGLSQSDAERISGRTERALIGFGPDGRFNIVAEGRYPDGAIARSLRRDGWEQGSAEAGELGWKKAEAPYRVVRIERDLYAVSSGEAIERRIPLPMEELETFSAASLAFYAPEPGRSFLAGMSRGGRLPIRSVFVTFSPVEAERGREVRASITTASEQDARTLLVLTRLLVVGTLNSAGIGFDEIPDSLTVEREEGEILVEGLYLREAQVARLFLDRVPPVGEGSLP